jgi:prevent-host-death family protein
MTTVKVHEAKTQLSALLARVESGEEIVIARGDRAVARLVPLEDGPRRDLGFVSFRLDPSFFDALPQEELAAWER